MVYTKLTKFGEIYINTLKSAILDSQGKTQLENRRRVLQVFNRRPQTIHTYSHRMTKTQFHKSPVQQIL